jgi:hypothetical protein
VRSIYFIWICPSAAGSGMSQSLSVLPGISSVSTRNGGGPGDSRCSVYTLEEVDGVGDKRSVFIMAVDIKAL